MDAVLAARVERIAADQTHGASWLAKEAVEAVVEAVQRGEDPLALARELVRARPASGAVAGALGRVLVAGRTPEQLIAEAHALIGSRERAAATIAARTRTVEQAQRVYDLTVLRYDRGLATQLEVSDARLALLQARTNLAQALSDFYTADATLSRALIGTTLAPIDAGLVPAPLHPRARRSDDEPAGSLSRDA